jgi:CMP-N-acetylneuraminic acid synthetase
MSILCVIPARRGSKRVKDKNIIEICGKPVISYTIEAALGSNLFDKVYVSTEDEEIKDIAVKYGAEVPYLRPVELSDDFTSSTEPCIHMYEYLVKEGKSYDSLLCLQPTSVLKTREDIIESVKIFEENDYDFLLSVTPIDPHYFHWALHETKSGWDLYFGLEMLKDRHELFEVFRPNGAIKLAKIEKLYKYRHFFGENLGVYNMPEDRAVHIASEFDIEISKIYLSKRNQTGVP